MLRHLIATAAIACATLTPISACSSGASQDSSSQTSPKETAADAPTAKQGVAWGTQVDARTFKQIIDKDKAVVIDVRTPEEFAQGHIPGAQNIDVTSNDFTDRIKDLDPSKNYAVYCRSGARSQRAVTIMSAEKIKHVVGLKGGVMSWEGKLDK